MSKHLKKTGLAAILLALPALAACGSSDESKGGAGGPKIRVGVVKASACAPVAMWEENLPEGATVEVSYYTAPADQATALMSGSIDLACTGLTIGVVANAQEQPIRVVAQTARKGTRVVAGAKSGITSVADFKGKKIGYAPNSIHDVVLRLLLSAEGLNPSSDVQLVKLGLADMPAALCDGAVDAFVNNEPNSSVAILRDCGTSVVEPYDTPIGAINAGILTSQKVIDDKPEVITAALKAHAASIEEISGDEGSKKIVDVAVGWGSDRAATEKSLENIEFAWKIDDTFVDQYQELAKQLKTIGLVTKDIDVSTIVESSFGEEVSGD